MAKLNFDSSVNTPVENTQPAHLIKEKKIKIPAAYQPKETVELEDLELIGEPTDIPFQDWDAFLKSMGYSPEEYEILGDTVRVSQWDTSVDGSVQKLYSYKATIRKRSDRRADYVDLIKEIKSIKPSRKKKYEGNSTFVVNIADTQFGKDDGDGTIGTVRRFKDAIGGVKQRYEDLRKIGVPIGRLCVAGVGDIIEGCDGHYAAQTFRVELNRRQQRRIARRLVRDAIADWAQDFSEVDVLAVGGNHGENRNNSAKLFTSPGDNDDVAIFEEIAEIFAFNPQAFGHVKFFLPEDERWIVRDYGTTIGWTHGHVTSGGGNPQTKIRGWWEDHAFSNTDIGRVQILVTGHYHHLSVIEYGPKVHIQCTTLDGGSEWYYDLNGSHSRSGITTFVIDERGYSNLEVV